MRRSAFPWVRPMSEEQTPSRPRRHSEYRVYGAAAARAVFARRLQDVVKVYLQRELTGEFSSALKALAARKVAYKLVEAEDLLRLAETPHHGGICLVVRRQPRKALAELLGKLGRRKRACLLLLENVGNPHNVGAILRSAAHFGVDAVLVQDASVVESGAASRTAAGGAEAVEVIEYGALGQALNTLVDAGFALCATSSHQGDSVFATELPLRAVFMFGEEQVGLSTDAFAHSSRQLMIPGSGAVESLNVSVAASILLAEHWRQHQVPPAATSSTPPSKGHKGSGPRAVLSRHTRR